jgi:hypothetical protein
MALDAIAGFVVRTVGPLVLELLFVRVFYWPGWFVLRIVTLGRYPPADGVRHGRELVAVFGFAVLLLGLTIAFDFARGPA